MIKKIFTPAVFVITLFIFGNHSYAQYMSFCESVDNSGNCTGQSSVFNISSNGGYLDVLVNIPYNLNCRSVRYEIYLNGDYNTTIYQDAQNNWQWFYKQITFYSSGTYTIYCIDCNERTLASGNLTIQFR